MTALCYCLAMSVVINKKCIDFDVRANSGSIWGEGGMCVHLRC